MQRKELDDRARDLRIEVADLSVEQKRADRDVEQVRSRRERDRSRMEQGLVTSPKDLERMGHELETLERRISSLEDDELEVMEKLEQTQSALDQVGADAIAAEERTTALAVARDRSSAGLRAEIENAVRERAAAVAGMPAELLALYEKLRAQKGGVGAAALRRRQCDGCRLGLDTTDLARIAKAPTDEVIRCEECNRILVRTSESGLGSGKDVNL